MKDPRKAVLISTIILLTLMFGLTFLKESFKNKTSKEIPSATVSPTIIKNKFENWTFFKNGYAFPLPSNWKNSSDTGGTAVLEPSDISENELDNIKKISVTVLSYKKATGQRFTTQLEFDQWSAVTGEVQGKIQKLENLTIDGEKGIMLIDNSVENKWKIIIWIRKDEINLYMNFDGEGKYNDKNIEVIKYITSHFSFIAPKANEKSGEK